MAIRKAGGAKTIKKTRKVDLDQVQQPKQKPEDVINELRQDLIKNTLPGVGRSQMLSKAEIGEMLDKAKAAGPDVEAVLQADLASAMTRGKVGENELKLGNEALAMLSAFTGVAEGTYRTAVQSKDAVAEHNLGEGLAKNKVDVSQEDQVANKNKMDELKLQGQNGARVSKEEFTPHYKAAQIIGNELKTVARDKLAESSPETLAAVDAVSPAVSSMVSKTMAQIGKDPEAAARVASVMGAVGQQGFAKAVGDAAPHVGKAFTEATGIQACNPAVVGPMLNKLPKLAESVAPSIAPKVADICAKCGAKLGLEVAELGAKQGAKGAAKAGAAASKTVPGLGNMVAVGCACLAGARLFKSLMKSPRDGESVAKDGLNMLMQTVGIAFPWVGLAGDVVDIGWSAKKAVTDSKAGKAPEEGLSKQEAAGMVGEPAKLLASVLEGAGKGGAAKAFSDLASVTENAADLKTIERHQLGALSQFSKEASAEVGKAAAQEQDPATRDALNTVAHGFGEVFKVLYQHKKLDGKDAEETAGKRADLQGQLLKVTGDIAMGLTAMKLGGKDASLDVIDEELANLEAMRQQAAGDAAAAHGTGGPRVDDLDDQVSTAQSNDHVDHQQPVDHQHQAAPAGFDPQDQFDS
jgi:hypothetical protein